MITVLTTVDINVRYYSDCIKLLWKAAYYYL